MKTTISQEPLVEIYLPLCQIVSCMKPFCATLHSKMASSCVTKKCTKHENNNISVANEIGFFSPYLCDNPSCIELVSKLNNKDQLKWHPLLKIEKCETEKSQ